MLNKIKSMILKWLFNDSIQYINLISGNLTTKEYVRCSIPSALDDSIKSLKKYDVLMEDEIKSINNRIDNIFTNTLTLEDDVKALKDDKKDDILKTPFKDNDGWVSCVAQDNDTLKRVCKVLNPYYNDYTSGDDNRNIGDLIDDLNDEFKGFNDIFNNINLTR